MSEAVVPNQPPTPSELETHQPAQPAPEEMHRPEEYAASDEGWTIVNFPNALSVEALSREAEATEVGSAIAAATLGELEGQPQGTPPKQDASLQQLQQQNQELRDQVSQLEGALAAAHTALREEMDRWQTLSLAQPQDAHDQVELIQRHNQELSAAQDRIKQLFRELELSHQTAQRQQILVETLTVQLQASQEQIAQLERECALTQQRYTEQVQLLHQSDNTCRDLRSRLHRQQRYTLQFKAALEKCLDVATPQANTDVWNVIDEATIVQETGNNHHALGVKLGIPRSQPVKPWSAPAPAEDERTDPAFQAWLNAFMGNDAGATLESGAAVSSESVNIQDAVLPSYSQPFWVGSSEAESRGASEELADDALGSAAESDWMRSLCLPQQPSESTGPRKVAPEPVEFMQESAQASELSIEPAVCEMTSEVSPIVPESSIEVAFGSDAVLPSQVDGLSVPVTIAPTAETETVPTDSSVQAMTCETSEDVLQKMAGIAPVLYPRRSAKKRESLAAVELPMFPRNGLSQA